MIPASNKPISKFILKLGIAVFTILLFMSIFYYNLRIGTLDNAFQTFLLITEKDITIMADRWPAVVVRLIPWVLTLLGSPLALIMLGFSISYILFQLSIFLILAIILKRPGLALLQILVLLLACSDGFYWCNSEQIQGLSVVILGFAIIGQKGMKLNLRNTTLLLFLFFALLYYHPILIFPFLYLFCFSSIDDLRVHAKEMIVAILFLIAWYIKNQFFSNWYDVMKSEEFAINFDLYFTTFWTLESIPQFFEETLSKYHFIIVGAIVSIFMQIRLKKLHTAFYTLFSAAIYFIIVMIGTPEIQYSFYTEINFYILILIFYFPILKNLSKQQRESILFKLIVLILLIVSIARIISFSDSYEKRLEWISTVLSQQQDCNKIVVLDSQLDPSFRLQTWSLPYESLILGHKIGIKKTLHPFVKQYEDEYKEDIFVTSFKLLEPQDISSRYFDFPEGAYCNSGE